jgi:lysyl-tRNA synthetase class 1
MEALFWADQKALEISERRKYRYLDREVPEFDKYTVKTSASISGVLHIGRLSDTIRSESVYRALRDAGRKAELIWVAEDMDPLRKIPEGVPKNFAKYLGTPVVDVPDPWGCHASYAQHHVTEYFEVLHEFISADLTRYSMKEEYEKGSFKPFIAKMLEKLPEVIEIQNKYRQEPLKLGWSPWTPICEGCGKIITPRIKKFEEGRLTYRCEDYFFEKTLAEGCGHEDEVSPLKNRGKLMWKGEWAAQWARWRVASEGAGKEYVVPSSAWWVNAEILERVFDFPMPVPIFYEHLMIDGKKMSASVGNVVYPRDWLSVASPQLLRFYYNKKLMKTRSFSWRDLPRLYDDYDRHALAYQKGGDDKAARHAKRLYEISQLDSVEEPLSLSFSHAALLTQMFYKEEDILASLKRSGHYDEDKKDLIMKRIRLAANWVSKYAPQEMKRKDIEPAVIGRNLDEKQRKLLGELALYIEEDRKPEEIHNKIYELSKDLGIQAKKAFQGVYLVVIGSNTGPRAGNLLASLDKKWVVNRFREVAGVNQGISP